MGPWNSYISNTAIFHFHGPQFEKKSCRGKKKRWISNQQFFAPSKGVVFEP